MLAWLSYFRRVMGDDLPQVVRSLAPTEKWLPVDGTGAAIPRPASVALDVQEDPLDLLIDPLAAADTGMAHDMPQRQVLSQATVITWRAMSTEGRDFLTDCVDWSWFQVVPLPVAGAWLNAPTGFHLAAFTYFFHPSVQQYIIHFCAFNFAACAWRHLSCPNKLAVLGALPIVPTPAQAALTLAVVYDLFWIHAWDRFVHLPGYTTAGDHQSPLQIIANWPVLSEVDGTHGNVYMVDSWLYTCDHRMAAGYRITRAAGYSTQPMRGNGQGVTNNLREMMFMDRVPAVAMPGYVAPVGMGKRAGQSIPTRPPGAVSANDDRTGHIRADSLGGRRDPFNFIPLGFSANAAIHGGSEYFQRGVLDACPCAVLTVHYEFRYGPVATNRRPSAFVIDIRHLGSRHNVLCNGIQCGIDGEFLPVGVVHRSFVPNVID